MAFVSFRQLIKCQSIKIIILQFFASKTLSTVILVTINCLLNLFATFCFKYKRDNQIADLIMNFNLFVLKWDPSPHLQFTRYTLV